MVLIFIADILNRFHRYWVDAKARDDRIAMEKAFERRMDAAEIYACDLAFSFTQVRTSKQFEALEDSLPSRYRNSMRCINASTAAVKVRSE